MSDEKQRHQSDAEQRVREQVERDRSGGRDLPAPGQPGDPTTSDSHPPRSRDRARRADPPER